jgi:hypothetical protein
MNPLLQAHLKATHVVLNSNKPKLLKELAKIKHCFNEKD